MDFFKLLPTYTVTPIAAAYVTGTALAIQFSNHKPLNFPYLMFAYNAVAIVLSFVTTTLFLHSLIISEKYLLLGLQVST